MNRRGRPLAMKEAVFAAALALSPAAPSARAGAPKGFEDSVGEASGEIKQAFARERAARSAPAFDAQRCRPESAQDQKLHSSDFRWDYTLPEMLESFEKTYSSSKRLPSRAYWNERKRRLELPHSPERGGAATLPESFVLAVTRHIERAVELGYVDAVFFPDMGHSHFLVPESLWERTYAGYPPSRYSRMYEELFKDAKLEVLYHTAEQLKTRDGDGRLVDDARARRRYETRNIVGGNSRTTDLRVLQNPESKANTVQDVPGYYWWSAGFNVSANENGCFSFTAKGKTYRFDLSLYDLEPAPETSAR